MLIRMLTKLLAAFQSSSVGKAQLTHSSNPSSLGGATATHTTSNIFTDKRLRYNRRVSIAEIFSLNQVDFGGQFTFAKDLPM